MSSNSTFSYWEQASFLSFDVAIVGSGIVGLNAALSLKESHPELEIVILERSFVPSGASTRNAGFACFGSVSELLDELESTGEDEMLQVLELRWRGLQKLRQNLGDRRIHFLELGGYEIFKQSERLRAESCIENIAYLNKLAGTILGKTDIYTVEDEKIAAFGLSGVSKIITNKYEGQIDSGKMMRALLQKVQSLGVVVINNANVTHLDLEPSCVRVRTSQADFGVQKVIVATNASATQFFPQLNVVPGRGQVVVTKPVPNLRLNGTFHYDRGYYYFRNIQNRVLLGGGRHLDISGEETFEHGTTDLIQSSLKDLLRTVILPGQDVEIDYCWSGIMGFGNKLLPIIEKLEENLYCAVRCNGMGVAMGTEVGSKVASLVSKDL